MSAESARTLVEEGLSRTRGDNRDVASLAKGQHGVVGRGQLMRLGLSEEAIDGRIRSGYLHPVHAGVYAVGHRALTQYGRWLAAVTASGPRAVLSHFSAAALWQIQSSSRGWIDVTVPHRSRSWATIRRHVITLPPDEQTIVNAIPVTTAARTILDLAAISSINRVEGLIRQAEYLRLDGCLSLPDLVERYSGRRGVRRVRKALDQIEALPVGRTRSQLEDRFLLFLRRHGLPPPRLNDWIIVGRKRFQVDCHWAGTGQVVELDGWRAHGTRTAFRQDRTRDRVLRTAGYEVTRISWAQLDDEPEAIASDLRRLLSVESIRRDARSAL